MFHRISLTPPLLLLFICPVVQAEVTYIDWLSQTGGLYADGANWQGGTMPAGDLMGPRFNTSVVFQQDVLVPNDAPLEIGGLQSDLNASSSLSLLPATGTADATISISGPLSHGGGTLEVDRSGIGVQTHVSSQSTVVSHGGQLVFDGGATLTTDATEIQVADDSSRLWLKFGGESALGQIGIGNTGAGQREGVLLIDSGVTATSGDIAIATVNAPDSQGELSLVGELTQTAASSLTIGGSGASVNAQAFVAGGTLTTGATTTIHPSGELRNLGSDVNFGGNLAVLGGRYLETGSAERSFAAGANIQASSGGLIQFATTDLLLDDSQTLSLAGEGTQVTVGGNLTLGASSTLSFDFAATAPSSAMLTVSAGVANLSGLVDLTVDSGADFTPGVSWPLLSAAAISGEMSIGAATSLPAGRGWQLVEESGVLSAVVIQTGLPGDYNGDDVVDAVDYAVWRETLGSEEDLAADGNGNNQVDAGDYLVWRQNYGQAVIPVSPAVTTPAPASAALLALGVAVLPTWRKVA